MPGTRKELDPDRSLRERLSELLEGGNAHANFADAVAGFPKAQAGTRPKGAPHSAWELLEHLRIAQTDILLFSQSADHVSPKWPKGYWPDSPEPARPEDWDESIRRCEADRAAFQKMLRDPKVDLHSPFPWGDGQTLLREALLLADHNSYHVGQLVLVRRLLGAWPE